MKTTTALFVLFSTFIVCLAQGPPTERQQFIRVEAPVIALTHVRVIDGTGAAPNDDQTIIISDGKIQSVGPSASANVPANAQVLDLKGYTVLPGLVGMHNHMFFPMGRLASDVLEHGEQLSAPLPRTWCHHDSHHRQRGAFH